MNWFTEMFINQVTPAVEFYRGIASGSDDDTQMYILLDEDGNEYPAVVVEEETIFDATANDIREGKVAATEEGVTVGTKEIPSYHTHEGVRVITPGSPIRHVGEDYDYTSMQAVICSFNTSLVDSVATEKVAIENNVYSVQSVEALASVTINHIDGAIEFGITNTSNETQLLRYFYYKEIY